MPDSSNTHLASIKELSDEGTGGARMGTASTDKIGFLGATPITQQTAGTYTSGNTSALIASLISLAVTNSNILKSFGFST